MVARSAADAQRAALRRALDRAGTDATLEIEGNALALTTLDRVYWPADEALHQPAITKRDYVRYLLTVAPAMLPHVRDRPLTLFRWPNGVAGRRVLQKHWEIPLPAFVERVLVFSDAKGHVDEYILCNNLATLVWLAHMGTLEIHVWHSRVRPGADTAVTSTAFATSTAELLRSVIEYPDYVLFDLDPFIYTGRETRARDPELNPEAFGLARSVAGSLKVLLDAMQLESLVKTSGKTGLHVIVPIRRTLTYADVRKLAGVIAAHLVKQRDDVTTQWEVRRRTGKVFLDYKMNVRGKSMTAPFSPRGLPGAPVSMPLRWSDLDRAYPLDHRIPTAVALLRKRGDAWKGWLDRKQSLEAHLRVPAAG